MIAAGIDAGSLMTKAIILNESNVIASASLPSGDSIEESAHAVITEAFKQSGLPSDADLYTVATGVGGKLVPARQYKSITTCLARGINFVMPSVRMGVDIGAESCTVVKITPKGALSDWINHDKCAAGTGIFLTAMAKIMRVSLDEMSELSGEATSKADITGTCAVFAESEVISHIHRMPPTPKEDIVAGIYASVISRLMTLCKRIGIAKDVAVTGGVACSKGMISMMEKEFGFNLLVPENPGHIAALGAAVIAKAQSETGV